VNRTSTGLALLVTGGIMLLAVVIPGAPLSIKIVGVFLAAAGLARLRLPGRAFDWLRQNSDRIMEAVDPGSAEVANTPRVPLDDLFSAVPGEAAGQLPGRPARDNAAADPRADAAQGHDRQDSAAAEPG
jgi:hypothetical protein